jgi:hypothetical protein
MSLFVRSQGTHLDATPGPPLLPDATAEYAALLTNVRRFRIATRFQ